MQSLLGKIAKITPLEPDPSAPSLTRLQVSFKPACLLPSRAAVPEWLADQTLTVERSVADAREIGRPGDSLVLTVSEASRWLTPLSVTPSVASGALPTTLELRLRWWKDEKPPEFTLKANGRRLSGDFAPDGSEWSATVETSTLFDTPPSFPVTIEITCDKFAAVCTVVPEQASCYYKTTGVDGTAHHLESDWFQVTISGAMGGGISALLERGRIADHFQRPADLIQLPLHHGGHADRLRRGWNDEALRDVTMACAGARRESGTTRLSLEGVVDDGQNLRTTVAYSLYDDLPLLLIQRDFSVGKGKDDDSKDKKPREPIEDMQPMGLSFRAAFSAERDGATGSRLVCADGDRLVNLRPVGTEEFHRYGHWRMTGGWSLAQHPRRGEHALYLFDPDVPPSLASWSGAYSLTLEPYWPSLPVRPGEATGYVLALIAGERSFASSNGAWVACRAPRPKGGVRCGLVGRLPDGEARVTFTLGTASRDVPVRQALLPGVGTVTYAVCEFPEGGLTEAFDAAVPGLASRRDV